jgi:hypothetical protein
VQWRECLEWTQQLGAMSMEQILRMGPDQRDELLDGLAAGLAEQLARMLAADGVQNRDPR